MAILKPPGSRPSTSPPAPTPPSNDQPGGNAGPSGNTGSSSSGGGGGGGGGSGGSGGMSAAESRAVARENKAKARAARRYSEQAQLLVKQANALKIALGKDGYKKALQTELGNAQLEWTTQLGLIDTQYQRGRKTLEELAGNTEDARARGTTEAAENAGRERAEQLAQGIAQGVGAMDMIKAQSASLRNWQANMSGVQESYTDSMGSLRSTHEELKNTILAQRASAWQDLQNARGQAKRTFYDNRGAALTEVGNKFGEASSYWEMANEQQGSKKRRKRANSTEKQAVEYLRKAAKQTGRAYENKPLPEWIENWEGEAEGLEYSTDQRSFGATPELATGRAEGATLRRWET